jgi:thiol:disulfide interchange protein DsbC
MDCPPSREPFNFIKTYMRQLSILIAMLLSHFFCLSAWAQGEEAFIRKTLKERMPQIQPIDEIRRTPMQGLFEIRVDGSEIFYTDAGGNFLIQGHLIDTKSQRDLTEERIQKILAVDFKSLPIKDALVIVRGKGERKMAIFEDPNCGYCKRFEKELQSIDNVTVYLFLYPILGKDSVEKSKAIWCSKEPVKAWYDFMLRNQAPNPTNCDAAAIKRNVDFGQKQRISGTPTTIFSDGTRLSGAVELDQIEKMLSAAKP